MFSFLKGLIGPIASIKISLKDVFQGFTLKQQVTVNVSSGGQANTRKYYATESRTALGRTGVSFIDTINDVRGLNATVVDEAGEITTDLLAAKLRIVGGTSKTHMTELAAYTTEYIRPDSQIALLVSMLSTYYVLEYKEAGSPLTIRDYNDGHVKIGLLDLISDEPAQSQWWNHDYKDVQNWSATTFDIAADRPVLAAQGFNGREVEILVAHLSGRRRTTRLAFDLEIPPLVEEGGAYIACDHRIDEPHRIHEVNAKMMRMLIDKYVIHNRLYGAFEAALGMFHQVAINPLPDCAEGYVWLKRRRTLVLPKFDAFRGSYHILLREQPFGLDTSTTETWKWWRDAGLGTAVPASTLNAFSLWGRYLAEAKFYHDDSNIGTLAGIEFGEIPAAAYYCYASLITGKDVYCPIPRNTGLMFEAWDDMTDMDMKVTLIDAEAEGYDLAFTGNGTAKLSVTTLPPPCSMVNILGRMPQEGAFSSLSDRFQVHLKRLKEGWLVPNINEAWGVAMAARWCGYNCNMEYRGKKRLANWAPNQSSIASRPFQVDGPDVVPVIVESFGARQHCFLPLPHLDQDENVWTVEVSLSEAISYMRHDNKPIMMRGTFLPLNAKRVDVFTPQNDIISYMPIVVRSSGRPNVRQVGFQVIGREAAHIPSDPVNVNVQDVSRGECVGEPDPGINTNA